MTEEIMVRRIRKVPVGRVAACAAVGVVVALLVPMPAYAKGILGNFLNIDEWACRNMVNLAADWFNIYAGLVGAMAPSSMISGNFQGLFGSQDVWNLVSNLHQTVVIPLAESILALFMLVQLIKISQRMDATATLTAVKDIVFLAVTFVIFHWIIVNSLDLVTAVYDELNKVSTALGDSGAVSPIEGLDWSSLDLSSASVPGCLSLLVCAAITLIAGAAAYVVAIVVALARGIQLYVMAAMSPVPLALLGFEDTRQMGIGFLKNFCAAALAGAIMIFLFIAYPLIASATAQTITSSSLEGLIYGNASPVSTFQAILAWLAISALLILGLVKSGSWAKDILGG